MRIREAYNILEINSHEPIIEETNHEQKLFQVRSRKEKDKFYEVNAQALKCKQIAATEILNSASFPLSSRTTSQRKGCCDNSFWSYRIFYLTMQYKDKNVNHPGEEPKIAYRNGLW